VRGALAGAGARLGAAALADIGAALVEAEAGIGDGPAAAAAAAARGAHAGCLPPAELAAALGGPGGPLAADGLDAAKARRDAALLGALLGGAYDHVEAAGGDLLAGCLAAVARCAAAAAADEAAAASAAAAAAAALVQQARRPAERPLPALTALMPALGALLAPAYPREAQQAGLRLLRRVAHEARLADSANSADSADSALAPALPVLLPGLCACLAAAQQAGAMSLKNEVDRTLVLVADLPGIGLEGAQAVVAAAAARPGGAKVPAVLNASALARLAALRVDFAALARKDAAAAEAEPDGVGVGGADAWW